VSKRPGFFTVGERSQRSWLFAPDGTPFWSIGMNHIDSSALRYPERAGLWRRQFGGSHERWLREAVGPDLRAWGFNTVGWTQEVVVQSPTIHRHSRPFTHEEYRWLGMPYCHLLPFTETHQWERETCHPDLFTEGFAEWCDHVARQDCATMADDPDLVGYFYVDCPAWVHSVPGNPKGPWFDPGMLESAAGRSELAKQATRYYQVTHDAIRRYDRNHLIFGDRYEACARLPDEILLAAVPYVDVVSFQYFAEPAEMVPDLVRWHELTGRPVLVADSAPPGRRPAEYGNMIRALRELSCCVGWHVCGAYLKNRCRKHGFRQEDGTPIGPLIDAATAANRETLEWVVSTANA
jgi:hypothetical protein